MIDEKVNEFEVRDLNGSLLLGDVIKLYPKDKIIVQFSKDVPIQYLKKTVEQLKKGLKDPKVKVIILPKYVSIKTLSAVR